MDSMGLKAGPELGKAIQKVETDNFKKLIKSTVSPYGDGGVSEKIIHHIREIPLQGIVKKTFYNR